MKKLFIIANWKSNKIQSEAKEWLNEVLSIKYQVSSISQKEIIVCPPFTLLAEVKSRIHNQESIIKVGAQDISPFDEGAYTGEISAKQIKEFANYVIIGHSERRKNFNENEDMINNKLEMAQKYELIPILCISNPEQVENYILYAKRYTLIVAYEPLFAIGSGIADTPENADQMANKVKDILGDVPVLYGGSVNSNNVKSFTRMPNMDGVLVGKASLDPLEFLKIVKNA